MERVSIHRFIIEKIIIDQNIFTFPAHLSDSLQTCRGKAQPEHYLKLVTLPWEEPGRDHKAPGEVTEGIKIGFVCDTKKHQPCNSFALQIAPNPNAIPQG